MFFMPGKYGFVNGVECEQSLDDMKIDIKTDNVFWVSAQCNKEEWKQRNNLSNIFLFPFTLGFRGGCVWVDGYSPGKIDFCYGYSMSGNLEHELMHCKGYAEHFLSSF